MLIGMFYHAAAALLNPSNAIESWHRFFAACRPLAGRLSLSPGRWLVPHLRFAVPRNKP